MKESTLEYILKHLGGEMKIDTDDNQVKIELPFRKIQSISRGRIVWKDIDTDTLYIIKVKDRELIDGLNCSVEYTNSYWESSIANKIWKKCPKCNDNDNFKKTTIPCEIGNAVHLTCMKCGYEEDITNYDLW